MQRILLPLLLLGGLLLLGATALPSPSEAQRSANFRVIVHAANASGAMSRTEVSNLFLRKTRRWPDGRVVNPVDLPIRSRLRETFSRAVHRRSSESIGSYWRQQIFSGRSVPPPEKPTDAQVIRFVAANPGAIGYVSTSADISRVRVLEVRGL